MTEHIDPSLVAKVLLLTGHPIGRRDSLRASLESLNEIGVNPDDVVSEVFRSEDWTINYLVREAMSLAALDRHACDEEELIAWCEKLGKSRREIKDGLRTALERGAIFRPFLARAREARLRYEFVMSVRVNVRELATVGALWRRKKTSAISPAVSHASRDHGAEAPEVVTAETFAETLLRFVNDRTHSLRKTLPPEQERDSSLSSFVRSLNRIVITDAKILQGSMEREIEFGVLSDHPTEFIGSFIREGVSNIPGVIGVATLPVAWRFSDRD